MKLKSMSASFGGLNKARLELGEGLNLISAPNEAGKSTWCAFLRAMFYGIPTRERDTRTTLAEKNRYQPWSGSPMAGSTQKIRSSPGRRTKWTPSQPVRPTCSAPRGVQK